MSVLPGVDPHLRPPESGGPEGTAPLPFPLVHRLSKNPLASGAWTRRPRGGLSSLRTTPRERWVARRLARVPQRVFCLPDAVVS